MNPSKLARGIRPGVFRRFANWFPPIRNSGVKIVRISDDWQEWDLRLRLGRRTRNYVGTHYGGTLYSAADPHYMLAWMHILGRQYLVWDKAATIRFVRPGRGHLTGHVRISLEEIADVRERLETEPKLDVEHHFQWLAADGTVVAEVDKIVNIRKKRPASH